VTFPTRDRIVHRLFQISVVAKGIDGVLEIFGGILLYFVEPQRIYQVVRLITQHELIEDPDDLVANYLMNGAHHLAGEAKLFAALFLLWHGVVKAGLVGALLARIRLAYPAAMAAFTLFVAYQLYRYSHTHSPTLLVLSVLDLLIIGLTWLEYRRLIAAGTFRGRRAGAGR